MKCDACDNEATVHEVTIRNGQKVDRHLCEHCARAAGMVVQSHAPATEILSQFIASQASGQPAADLAAPAVLVCPTCHLTFAQFRQAGVLGCPDCYRAFDGQLSPLLERYHEGGTHHVGKVPRRAVRQQPVAPGALLQADPALVAEQERLRHAAALRRALDLAIAAEQYERAAAIRDQLRRLDDPAGPWRPASPPDGPDPSDPRGPEPAA